MKIIRRGLGGPHVLNRPNKIYIRAFLCINLPQVALFFSFSFRQSVSNL